MNVTMFLEKDLDHLKKLQQHESLMLTFSYYSGFIISSFNFFIFLIAITLYFQVIVDSELLWVLKQFFFSNFLCCFHVFFYHLK